jgi:hypothetical protein
VSGPNAAQAPDIPIAGKIACLDFASRWGRVMKSKGALEKIVPNPDTVVVDAQHRSAARKRHKALGCVLGVGSTGADAFGFVPTAMATGDRAPYRQGGIITGLQFFLKMVAVAPRLLRSRNSFRTFGNRCPPAIACAAF